MSARPLIGATLLLWASVSASALAGTGLSLPPVPDLIGDPLLANPELLDQGQPFACTSEFDSKQSLSLADAVDQALCHNPQVKLAWAGIKAQAGGVGEARAAYLPTLNLTVNRLFNSTEYPDTRIPTSNNQGTTKYANLTWRLFNFGAREANLEAANLLLHSAIASHHATVQKILASVIGAYFDAATAEAVYQARHRARQLADSTLQATRHRESSGVAAISDVLQAQTAFARAQLAQERALGDLKKAHAALVYMMGLPPATPLHLPDNMGMPAAQQTKTLQAWLEEAQTRHPAIVAAQAQLKASQAKIDALRREGIASLDLTYSYYENGYPNQGLSAVQTNVTTYGLTLTIPIFEGFARTYKIRGAQAQAEQNEARLQDALLQTAMEVVKAHADAQSSLENLKAAQLLIQSAEAAVKSAERRYNIGAADILELLSTQNTLADAQQERIRSLAEWHAARLKLLAAAGALTQIPRREAPIRQPEH